MPCSHVARKDDRTGVNVCVEGVGLGTLVEDVTGLCVPITHVHVHVHTRVEVLHGRENDVSLKNVADRERC